MANPPRALLLYDGDCALCAGSVQFLAPRDRAGRIHYAAIAGPHGRARACAAGVDPDQPETVVLLLDGRALTHSDAALGCLKLLGGGWALLAAVVGVIPRPLRDWVYRRVAENRYRLFGRACLRPDPAWSARVLD